ncbi:hypothetical protein FACS189473_0860 [Spirochaetia bacterium]|nr:hypothetical protein FACS189473_0860 [Spirochaetia bacterium]
MAVYYLDGNNIPSYSINPWTFFFNTVMPLFFQVSYELAGVMALYKRQCQVRYWHFVQGCVQAAVAVDLVEIFYRDIVCGAFVLYDVFPTEDSGDVFFYDNIRSLLDD